MGELKLKNGQFIRDGKVVPAEIGNVEQIALLKARERELERAEVDGIGARQHATNISYSPVIAFYCLCGWHQQTYGTRVNAKGYLDSDYVDDMDGDTVTCDQCGRKYIVDGDRLKLQSASQKQ
jgi:hypothetical protein